MLKKTQIEYRDGDTVLEGYYVYDEKISGKRPAILVAHDWSGKNDFACQKADKLAELGYVGFALDMFGKGKIGHTKEEKTALIQPLIQNRHHLLNRILSALHTVEKLDSVDNQQIAAIGFCFGGLCVLDLARSGANLKGVVSFHGLLQAPEITHHSPIQAKILALHGFDDPMVKPEQTLSFCHEMTEAKADWQLLIYGQTMHAFTNPKANDPDFGTVYNPIADSRSWMAMKDFFQEVLQK